MVIFGSRLYGKVDAVPGLGYVATKFGHLNFVPLIPLEGWLVVAEEGNGWRGQAIGMSGKSVLVAWARFLFIVGGIISLIVGLASWSRHSDEVIVPGVLALACIGGLIASYTWKWVTHASPERALEIAREAGVSEEGLEQLRRMYSVPAAAPAVAAPAQPWTPPES
ncbi:hypothetical protein [Corallococcus aberystwythensis]|uniref:Uncharacterized protein n=1 Tax=Corallococcus aberystwythensis TaxID=2316722 RepID=A0A3A8PXG6_9BACT|nr:hypothetical protein [Corallococcus aberystwythensis]RKH57102.1 hypothetical protein D7W81_32100 [Corallococcus aberystwythensis]